MSEIHERILSLEQRETPTHMPVNSVDGDRLRREKSIILTNVRYSQGEHLVPKIQAILRKGCGLHDVSVVAADRKKARDGSLQNGIVVAELMNKEERKSILKTKPKLRSSRNHRNIFIDTDLDPRSRANAANLRLILSELGKQDDL